jgi:phosphoglycolate phosphatase-like HAD superfamily hydrolase
VFRNIIWDFDGTLFDTYPSMVGAVRAALNEFGREAPMDWLLSAARTSLSLIDETLASKYGLDRAKVGQALEKHFDRIPVEHCPPFPGAADLCRYVYSSAGQNVIVTHRRRRSTMELLEAHRIAAYIDGCITHDDGYPRKPDPTSFEATLAIHGLRREQTLAVGDRSIDIQAGKAAGLFTCLYGDGDGDSGADLRIRSFGELQEFMTRSE